MKYTTTFLTMAFAGLALADDCSQACTDAHDKCLSQPNANHASCAADYASCLGYNPYEASFVEPTACSATTTSSPTATSHAADACAADCISKHEACQTKPDANMAVCAADFAGCLGYNPYEPSYMAPTACSATTSFTTTAATPTSTGKADACAADCISKHEACQTKPDANMAVCAADFAGCLGYNPYEPTYMEPTACSATTSLTATVTPITTESPIYVAAAGERVHPVLGLLAIGAAALF